MGSTAAVVPAGRTTTCSVESSDPVAENSIPSSVAGDLRWNLRAPLEIQIVPTSEVPVPNEVGFDVVPPSSVMPPVQLAGVSADHSARKRIVGASASAELDPAASVAPKIVPTASSHRNETKNAAEQNAGLTEN